jgi:hypothetical protein
LPVTFLRWLFRTIEWLVFAGVLIVGGYVLMMSGIFHRPDTVFTAAPYRHAGGGILVVGGTRGTGLEVIRELLVRGEQVTAMVRESSDTRALDALGVERVVADAMNAEEVPCSNTRRCIRRRNICAGNVTARPARA